MKEIWQTQTQNADNTRNYFSLTVDMNSNPHGSNSIYRVQQDNNIASTI